MIVTVIWVSKSKECFVNIFQFLTKFTTVEIKLKTVDLFSIGIMKVG